MTENVLHFNTEADFEVYCEENKITQALFDFEVYCEEDKINKAQLEVNIRFLIYSVFRVLLGTVS